MELISILADIFKRTNYKLWVLVILTSSMHANPSYCQTLLKVWKSEPLFEKPESTVYDSLNNIIYVSNINGDYCSKDGNGFISKINLKGQIEELKWIDGLDSPQGLGLHNDKLYIADVNIIRVVDVKRGQITNQFIIDTAQFLNDIAVDINGDIYVSDCKANVIYKLVKDKTSVWLDDPKLSGPNGLLCRNHDILILNMGDGKIFSVDKDLRNITEFSNGITNCDGIIYDGNNGYYVSGAWQGELYFIDSKGNKSLILNLGKDNIIVADIGYVNTEKLIIVPTLYKTVIAYKINP